jgi:hypothetical protein
MDITKLKEMLSEIHEREIQLRDQFKTEMAALKDSEREMIEDYLSVNAKYRTNEKVLRKEKLSKDCYACFIGWRDINKKTWGIECYTHSIKKDGTPSKLMSTYPCPEDCIKPYK